MKISGYKPNFDDPRVRRRIIDVLAWCSTHLSITRPEPVHHKKLRKIFGAPGNPLTDFLRANLLIQHGIYIANKKSLSYLLNETGYEKLIKRISNNNQHMVSTSTEISGGGGRELASLDFYREKKGEESINNNQYLVSTSAKRAKKKFPQIASLDFVYKLQSNRYCHPLQHFDSDEKERGWHDHLPFNYDIEACAPTLLSQCARQAGLPSILLTGVQDYLDNRKEFTEHVAALTGLPLKKSKGLITSLFNGARLAANRHCAAFRTMQLNVAAMRRMQADPKVCSLVRSIKAMWKILETSERNKQQCTFAEYFAGLAKPFEKKLKTSKQKWNYYFAKERQVLDAMTAQLDQDGIKYFKEHDGFRTNRSIDIAVIEAAVVATTGFTIKLKLKIPTNTDMHLVSSSSEQSDANPCE